MNWNEMLTIIAVTASSQTIIFGVLGFFGKKIVEHSINKSLELKKHELNKEFENYRLKISLLQNKRFEVIEELYKDLIDLRDSIYNLTDRLKSSNGNFDEEEKTRIKDTEDKYNTFIRFYNYHKIYLSQETCDTLDKLRSMFWRGAYDYSQIQRDKELGITGDELRTTYQLAMAASDFVRTDISGVLTKLENDFRLIVGVNFK